MTHSVRFFAVGQCKLTALTRLDSMRKMVFIGIGLWCRFRLKMTSKCNWQLPCYFGLAQKLRSMEFWYDECQIEVLFSSTKKRKNKLCLFGVVLMCSAQFAHFACGAFSIWTLSKFALTKYAGVKMIIMFLAWNFWHYTYSYFVLRVHITTGTYSTRSSSSSRKYFSFGSAIDSTQELNPCICVTASTLRNMSQSLIKSHRRCIAHTQ